MKVFITGGSRGIGRSICNLFIDNQIEVICPIRSDFDLSDPSTINLYLKSLPNDIGILINNAGINNLCSIENSSYEDLLEIFNVNYFSHYLISSFFLKRFKKQDFGRIVNISSIWAGKAKADRSIYAGSKAALHSLTRQMTAETAGFDITTNTISPGYIETDLTYQNNTNDQLNQIIESIPLKRLGLPEEIAKLAFNLTIDNTYINGQEIIIDGGVSCAV